MMDIYSRLERVLSRLKGRKYEIDRRIPVSLMLAVMLRRLSWMLRGLFRTLLLQRRPRPVFIAPNVNLRNASLVHFGNGVTLERGVIIDGLSTNGIRLGDNVAIGAYSIVCAAMLSHLGDGIQFGNNSSTGPYSFIGAGGPITIGENVIMGQHVSFHSENHNFDRIDLPIRSQGVNRVGILVEDDCWVGANVVFLDGAHVGRGSVVAAGAVVRGKIPPYSVVAGVPARVLRSRLPNEAPLDSLCIAASSS
jgi:acetyltransferase-like isoleucine patch superfamily enzyme